VIGSTINFVNTLYAIALDWPASGKLTVKSVVGAKVKDVALLGHRGKLKWQQTAEGLVVTLPSQKTSEHAFALKINGDGLMAP
jgi:alpha-L-fucosidase